MAPEPTTLEDQATTSSAGWPGFDVDAPSDDDSAPSDEQSSSDTSTSIPNTPPSRASIADRFRAGLRAPRLTGAMRDAAATGLADVIAGTFRAIGSRLHRRRTPGAPYGPDNDIWLVTDDEAKAIAEPAGRVLARSLPGSVARLFAQTAAGGVVGDGVQAADALRAYVRENTAAEAEYRATLEAMLGPADTAATYPAAPAPNEPNTAEPAAAPPLVPVDL